MSDSAAFRTDCDDGDPMTEAEACSAAGRCTGQRLSAELKAAVVKCVKEEPTGSCVCQGLSCSADPRFAGPLGTWDVSQVRSMQNLFSDPSAGNGCSIFCTFDGNLTAWDTSSVTRMENMSVWPVTLLETRAWTHSNSADFPVLPGSMATFRSGTRRA